MCTILYFSDISEQNDDYSDTLDFRRVEWGRWGSHVFVFKIPDYKSVMLLYLYICIRTRDTGRSFEPIFMKFTQLGRAHSRVNPIVFGNNRPNRTTDMGENVPPNQFFGFISLKKVSGGTCLSPSGVKLEFFFF